MHSTFAPVLWVLAILSSATLAQTTSGEQHGPAKIAPASAESFTAASQRVIATVQAISQVEGASPAVALVMVRRGAAPLIWTQGRLDANSKAPANADTPFYVASQTKSFVGLLALQLHARGIFSLDRSLVDVWPALRLPAGADPHAITFRQLLSHQGVIANEPLEFRTSYTDRVPARDYPRLLSAYSTVRAPGFEYSNIGYLIYGAALETQTERDWRDWIDDEILRPAGMTRTAARAARFPRAEQPFYHHWLGGSQWQKYRVKDDALMHAAGGLVISPTDMGRWLRLQLGETPGVAAAGILAQSHQLQIASNIDRDVLDCQGYAVGWNVCRIGAVDVLWHGGGYTAVRSAFGVSPELGVGFAFLSNSDSLTGLLSQLTTQIFFETLQDPQWQGPAPQALQTEFRARLARMLQGGRDRAVQRRAEAQWQGWTWQPTAAELRPYVGRYRSPAFGDVRILLDDGGLTAQLGAMRAALEPAKPDLFASIDDDAELVPVAFERNGGRLGAFTWRGERFQRAN